MQNKGDHVSSNNSTPASPTIAEQLLQMSIGYIPAISLQIVAALRVPEQLTNGPKPVEDIARAVGANPDALYLATQTLRCSPFFGPKNSMLKVDRCLLKMG